MTWTGNLSDDCYLRTDDGYTAHAEAMDTGANEHWCSIVTHGERPSLRYVFHSAESGIWPRNGEAARRLCEDWIEKDRNIVSKTNT